MAPFDLLQGKESKIIAIIAVIPIAVRHHIIAPADVAGPHQDDPRDPGVAQGLLHLVHGPDRALLGL